MPTRTSFVLAAVHCSILSAVHRKFAIVCVVTSMLIEPHFMTGVPSHSKLGKQVKHLGIGLAGAVVLLEFW